MIKTIELILGLPPMNQMDLATTAMRNCFVEQSDMHPFMARPTRFRARRDEPAAGGAPGHGWIRARKSLELELDDVDEADEETLNRIVWHATRGYDVAYPTVGREND